MKRARPIRIASALLLCWLGGCGGAAYPPEGTLSPSPVDCDADATACDSELRAKRVELDRLLQRIAAGPATQATGTPAPDCAGARDLRDRICDLAAAICDLSARNVASAELQRRCSAADTTCSQARDDVAKSCDR